MTCRSFGQAGSPSIDLHSARDSVATCPSQPATRHVHYAPYLDYRRSPSTQHHHGDERNLGFDPTDREFEKLGYDIESRVPGTGKLRFIEVKGRVSGASTIKGTRTEILYSLNKPEDFILGIVEFRDDNGHRVRYVRRPFHREPDFGVISVSYDFAELPTRAERPS